MKDYSLLSSEKMATYNPDVTEDYSMPACKKSQWRIKQVTPRHLIPYDHYHDESGACRAMLRKHSKISKLKTKSRHYDRTTKEIMREV